MASRVIGRPKKVPVLAGTNWTWPLLAAVSATSPWESAATPHAPSSSAAVAGVPSAENSPTPNCRSRPTPAGVVSRSVAGSTIRTIVDWPMTLRPAASARPHGRDRPIAVARPGPPTPPAIVEIVPGAGPACTVQADAAGPRASARPVSLATMITSRINPRIGCSLGRIQAIVLHEDAYLYLPG